MLRQLTLANFNASSKAKLRFSTDFDGELWGASFGAHHPADRRSRRRHRYVSNPPKMHDGT